MRAAIGDRAGQFLACADSAIKRERFEMFVTRRGFVTWAAAVGGVFMLSLAVTLGPGAADDKTYVMKIALATLDDALHQYAKNYAAAVEKDSGGRIKAEIYPASQLGSIERQAQAVQFGAIQCQIVAPEFLVGIDERFEVFSSLMNSTPILIQPDIVTLSPFR